MPKKRCIDCETRPVVGGPLGNPENILCSLCLEYSEWENQHSDDGHTEANPDSQCWVCLGLDPKIDPPEEKKGHSNGIPRSHTSHAGCSHPKTKSARAACRRKREL